MRHPNRYLEQLYQNVKPKFRFQANSKEEWKDWRGKLQDQFRQDLGGFPAQPAELAPVLLESVDCGGYRRDRVELTTFSGLRMPVYLLVPHDANDMKRPAVIACHGHGYGSKEIVGLEPDGKTPAKEPGYQQQFAVELVKRGFVVAAPELLGFGDRKTEEDARKDAYSSCHAISTYLLHMGHTMAGHRVYETIRVADYLLTRSDVQADRIGIMGISGGGLVALFAAALDERIRAAVISGYVNMFKDSILSIHHCVDNYIPGLGRHAEMPDIAGLVAPRPLLVESGKQDPIFPIEATKQAYAQLRKVYQLLGEEGKLEADFFEGDHRISGAKAYDWLIRWLQVA